MHGKKYIVPSGAEPLGFIKQDLLFYDGRSKLYGTSNTNSSYYYNGPAINCCIPVDVVASAAPAPAAPVAPAYAGKKRGRKKSFVFETVLA